MNKNIKYILIIGTAFIIWKISRYVYFYQITVHKEFLFAQIIKHFAGGSIIGLAPLVVGLKKNKKEYGTIGFFIALYLGMTWKSLFISIFLLILILFQTTNANISLTRNIFFTISIISASILFGLYITPGALSEMSPLGLLFLCNLIITPLSMLIGFTILIIEKKKKPNKSFHSDAAMPRQ